MISGIVAIVGRPNVGKSTLFNRMTETRHALVDDRPGVTRDRLYGTAYFDSWKENGFILVDTGGFETDGAYFQPFKENLVWKQTSAAIEQSDVVILLYDAKSGLHPHDAELTRYLQSLGKPIVYAVNKVDTGDKSKFAMEFYELGIDEPIMVSAAHGRNVDDLLETLQNKLAECQDKKSQKMPGEGSRIALIGRPNVGKSSILNRLLGEERSLVSDVAGTTRDAIDTAISFNKNPYVLVDTAGIRRRAKVTDKIESLSVMRSLQVIDRSDIVILVIDAKEGLTDQDARLADLAASEFKPMIIVVNKWDLVADKESNTARDYESDLKDKLRLLTYVPVIFVSCLENQRIHKIMQIVENIVIESKSRADTRLINDSLETIVQEHTPALIKKYSKRPKFYYATQVAISPPTIVIFCNVADDIQESYKRYMANRFRDLLNMKNVPLRLIFRSKAQVRERQEEGHSYTRFRKDPAATINLDDVSED